MNATGAVVFLPREGNGPSLMLEELLFDPAALWLAESLRAAGVERFFVVCHTGRRPASPPAPSLSPAAAATRWSSCRLFSTPWRAR